MKNRRIVIFLIVIVITIAFAITFGKTYAKYVLTKHFETTFSSLPFYFDAKDEDKGLIYTSIIYDSASFNITVSNNNGKDYNLFDTEYQITMEENAKYELSKDNAVSYTIKGNSLINDKIDLTLNIKDKDNPIDTFTIVVKSVKPYAKEIKLNFRVINANKIAYIEDLVDLSLAVAKGDTYKGESFALARDLDFQNPADYREPDQNNYGDVNNDSIKGKTLREELTNTAGRGFPSIGNYQKHFQGSFDGQGNTLSNIYIHSYTNNNHPEYEVVSFFGFITDATVKNFTITGNVITEQKANVGGVASYASNVSIENVHNYVNVTSNGDGYSVGGIIGSVGNDNIGLMGDNIRISNSSNHATLHGGNHGGGLVGATNSGSHIFIESSHNEGIVSNSIITNAGILALSNGNCYINDSYNIGEISTNSKGNQDGTISLGGLVAANYGSTFVINSYNLGGVTYNGSSNSSNSIAGLIGLTQGGAHVLNSYNQGTIKDSTTRNYLGGIANTVTWNNNVHKQIYNTYNTGTLSGGNTRYQIGYLYGGGDIKTSYYKSGSGNGSNGSGTTAVSDTNMRLTDGENTSSLLYMLNAGLKNINLNTIKSDLINHGYNSNYFDLSLRNWIIDSKNGYPTLDYDN